MLGPLSEQIAGSIPFACQDWAATKAAYRFLSNERVSDEKILAGHLLCTRERFAATRDRAALVLHDTTELIYRRENSEAIGIVHKQQTRYDSRPRFHTTCGVLMHSTLVVTQCGLPLGLAAIKFWTRDKLHGANALKRKINPTRVPIERKQSYRWLENVRQSTALLAKPQRIVHIGDRESDIYELLREVKVQGLHRIDVRNKKGEVSQAVLELRYRRIRVLPPIGKQKLYPARTLTVYMPPSAILRRDREPIDQKLVTDLPIRSGKQAIEKLNWYAMRWKIETFHKILKSGFKAEESRLRAAERIVNLITILCLLSWRVFWMTMINRAEPEASPELALIPTEIYLLDQLIPDLRRDSAVENRLSLYLTKLARLGGYMARAKNPPPGNTLIWSGLTRLTDIQLGFILGIQLVGN